MLHKPQLIIRLGLLMHYTYDEWILSVKFIAALLATALYLNYPALITGNKSTFVCD